MTFEKACETFRSRELARFDSAADTVLISARRGLTDGQIELLCRSIAASGDKVSLPRSLEPFVDVPSTGGPASLTTLLCPLLIAAFGFHVPKLSAAGSVAGGIDTMAVIPGFRANLAGADFISVLRRCRFAHAEPSETFCPADTALVRKRRAARMMGNPGLAAASLLGKKLATPHTRAVFDFRVGPAGNIGRNLREARLAKRLFERIAQNLNLEVRVILTENRVFPSSALGRLESLSLLWQVLSNAPLLKVDQDHVRLCIDISVRACLLADKRLDAAEIRAQLAKLLKSGAAKRRFIAHLRAQGAGHDAFQRLMESRNEQKAIILLSADNGYWIPPDLNRAKEWLKQEQALVGTSLSARTNGSAPQVGLRLSRVPGEFVREGQNVIELRYPKGVASPKIPKWLAGRTRKSRPMHKRQLIG